MTIEKHPQEYLPSMLYVVIAYLLFDRPLPEELQLHRNTPRPGTYDAELVGRAMTMAPRSVEETQRLMTVCMEANRLIQEALQGRTSKRPVATDDREDALWAIQKRLTVESAVYFVRGVDTGIMKIGVSRSLVGRMKALASSSPVLLQLHMVLLLSEEHERLLHERFQEQRSHGEWFRGIDDEVLQALAQEYGEAAMYFDPPLELPVPLYL